MAKIFEHYREFDYQEDYERLAWQREQELNEQQELEEFNNNKNYGLCYSEKQLDQKQKSA